MEEDPACCVLAGGAMSKLAAKLDGLLIRSEWRRRHMPIPWEVKNVLIPLIKQNLESMMAIIQEDGDDNSSRAVIRCLTKEVRELSYDIHDCIDEHAAGPARDHATRLLWRMERHVRVAKAIDKRGRSTRLLWRMERHVRVAKAIDKRGRSTALARRRTSSKPIISWLSERLKGRLWLLDKMREFSARSAEVLHRYNSFNRPLKKQRNGDSHGDSSTKAIATRSEAFGSWSPPSNAHLLHRRVGIHDLAMYTLKAWLTDGDSPKLKVVSIVGCGGLGKTTLANELYRGIGGQFECRAFVRTSQKPDVRRLLIDILSQIRPKQPPGNWKVHNLIGDIRTHLQDKRYLIVIDDVWARSTWDIVNRAFPDGNHCSRILITSELEDVALNCCGYEPQYVYKIKPLSEDDSRMLFYSIGCFPQELSGVSNSVIRKCGGLPLAIVTIASLLASRMGKPEQREYAEYVDKSLGYGLMTNPTLEEMKQVVNLSYRFLPQHLKACMLYLCIFPEDYIIWTDDLLKQWIAEGFICATEGQDEMEISRGYFEELISSRLIQAIHIDGNDKVLSCTMHHMMRNHIMQESIVENFVAVIDYSQTATRFAQKVRRLSLHFGNAEDTNLSSNMRLSQVRTLAFFGAFKCVPSITEFRLLQILILHIWGEEESIKFDLTSISEIFRLRYLQVTCNVTLEIQQMQMLRRLQYLETLKIDAARGSKISSDVVHLPRLLHLRLPAETNLPSGISRMISLRTLGHFDLSTNSIERVRTLGELTNVQDLQLTCTPMGPSHYLVKQMECLSSVLGKLNNLKCLTLKISRVVDHGRRTSSMSISCDVLSGVPSPPALLQRLEWLPRVCTFSNLPEWIDHLGKLCILKIGVRELVRNDVDLLKGLPALTVLSLYVHKKPTEIIVFSKGGFLVLKYFGFRCSIPCLKFEVDVMPNLRKLKLGFDADGAIQYSPIPAGLDHLSGLKEISAKIGGASANEPVRRIVELALSDATRMHTGRPTVNIQCVDQMFGDKDDQNIRLQEEKHMTPQKQYEPIEEDSNKQHVTLQKGFREDEDAVSRLLLRKKGINFLGADDDDDSGAAAMGIAAPPCHERQTTAHVSQQPKSSTAIYDGRPATTANSMSHSQGFHSGVYGFSSDGFDRPGSSQDQEQEQQHHVAQQSRRDKLRVQGFDPTAAGLLPIDDDDGHAETGAMYDHAAAAGASNMLAEMFNFSAQTPSGPSATELLASQMNANYRFGFRQAPGGVAGLFPGDGSWFGSGGPGRAGVVLGGANLLGETSSPKQQDGMAGLGATDRAAAVQLFLMNPQQQQQQQSRSSPTSPPPSDAQSAIQHHEAFHAYGNAASSFGGSGAGVSCLSSVSLSPSLQQLEMAKQAEELRVRDGVLYFNRQQQQAPSVQQLPVALHGQVGSLGQQLHVGYGPAGVAGVLRNSKYTRAAQELLDEFCSVGRGQTIKGGGRGAASNPNASKGGASSSGAAQSPSSASKEPPQLSPADRFDQQRKKAKLISMLDEVDRRYNHYCDQMQMVVNFFDSVMGFGAATPYTALAQKAMSRHFRCLKDAIAAQLRHSCELLGEKDAGTSSGLTKGETPRLRAIDQSLRQQRAFHHMGMMEQEAWRPQRGLPERSVSILRSWLFEHFLHPYPSDADKHLLARQTGLSRNQVSNWFINARVRLWKPMIEEMYQQETKELEGSSAGGGAGGPESGNDPSGAEDMHSPTTTGAMQHAHSQPQGVMQHGGVRYGIQQEHGMVGVHPHKLDPGAAGPSAADAAFVGLDPVELLGGDAHVGVADDLYGRFEPGVRMRYAPSTTGAAAGDVSLTLGLQHAGAGNPGPDGSGRFSLRDYNGC